MIEKDSFHAGLGTSDFYFEPFTEAFWVENEEGGIAVRLSRTMRVNASFDPDARKNNAVLLTEFTNWIANAAAQSGYREVMFRTENDSLAAFEKNLGFAGSPNEMLMNIEPVVGPEGN